MGKRARRRGLTRAETKRTTDHRLMDGRARHFRWLGRKVTVRAERGTARYTFDPPLGQPVIAAITKRAIGELPRLPPAMRAPREQLMTMARDQQARDELERMIRDDDDDAAPDDAADVQVEAWEID